MGVLGSETPVNNYHGLVRDKEGHIILLTDHARNNVIVYDKSGNLVHKWGTQFPGAHGLSLASANSREVLYLTDLQMHKVFKTTLSGDILQEWGWPKDRNSRGFVSVLDENLRVLSNVAGSSPIYHDAGKLQPMRHREGIFMHPHDLIVDEMAAFTRRSSLQAKLTQSSWSGYKAFHELKPEAGVFDPSGMYRA
jgi:hypothetical protein